MGGGLECMEDTIERRVGELLPEQVAHAWDRPSGFYKFIVTLFGC